MLTRREFEEAARRIRQSPRLAAVGRVVRVTGLLIEAHVPGVRIGDIVEIDRPPEPVLGEVVGFRDALALVVPLTDVRGVGVGAVVRATSMVADVPVSQAMLGRVIDPFGAPLDGGAPITSERRIAIDAPAPPVLARLRIQEPFETGVRAIDALLTCGRGQRVGLFAGAGVGKTVLIRQIAAMSKADVTVIGLIGERGNEARDLLEMGLPSNAVMVVATSDRSPMERARGARAATAIAEHFRSQGKNVLLILDSLTRYAMALREVGLAAGEPPATKGYPPSVFATLPKLLERVSLLRAGGSITAFYTVLVEGDDLSDPVADCARSLLDGHIVLSRDLAAKGHFPAIDVLASASRVSRQVATPDTQMVCERARAVLAVKQEVDELRSLGAYVPGANPAYDAGAEIGAKIVEWSRQKPDEPSTLTESIRGLAKILFAQPGAKGAER